MQSVSTIVSPNNFMRKTVGRALLTQCHWHNKGVPKPQAYTYWLTGSSTISINVCNLKVFLLVLNLHRRQQLCKGCQADTVCSLESNT